MARLNSYHFSLRAATLCCGALACCMPSCLVDNPAFDPRSPNARRDGDASAAMDALSFRDGDQLDVAPPADTARLDVPPDLAADGTTISAIARRCDPNHADLSLCLAFDGDLNDQSGKKTSIKGTPLYVPGLEGSAYAVKESAGLQAAASSVFVSPKITVDLWVRLSTFPATQTQALVDVPGVISVLVTRQGELVCDVGGVRATGTLKRLTLNTWTGVSCSYDGIEIVILVNGFASGARPHENWLPAVAEAPIHIGSSSGFSSYTGSIDNLRVWRRRLQPSDLCAASPDCVK